MSTSNVASRGRALAVLIAVLCCLSMLGFAACGGSANSRSASASSASASSVSASASSASASSSSAASGETVSFTDSCGRTVELPASVDRVAVTGPISQMAMLTLAPEKLVGLSNELSKAEIKYLGSKCADLDVLGQIYGGKGDFNKEAVANAHPQVIIDIGEAKKTIVEDLGAIQEATGIPCVHIEASFDTYDVAYEKLGKMLGVQDRAKELSDYCINAFNTTSEGLKSLPEDGHVKVAYLLGDAGLNAMARGSFQALVVDLVADNVAVIDNPGGSGLGSETSFEQIAMWDPEMIIFAPGSVYSTVADDSTWNTLTAVKSGNYYEVPGEPYNWISSPPGINQILGYQWLARLCYPSQYSDSMSDIVKEYYKVFYGYDMTQEECDALLANAQPKA